MVYPAPNRVTLGANLPWIRYATDVGASAWYPAGGLSAQPAALDLLDRTLAALARDGMSTVGLGDRPVILGEFPGRSLSVAEVLDAAKRAGYAGALVWSALAEDNRSAYPADLANWSGPRQLQSSGKLPSGLE